MRRATLLLLPLLAACGDEVDTAELTGLYQGQGQGDQRDRICIVKDPEGFDWFGIVALGPNREACSGIGPVERNGDAVLLTMAGDEECTIQARLEGRQLTLPASLPESCAYYCSPGTSLAGRTFEKTDDTHEAAMEAEDLVGNPLCS